MPSNQPSPTSSPPPPPPALQKASQQPRRPSPPEALVQAYLIHISDRNDSNFRKVLDLKGVRKADQPHLIELFQLHRAGPQHNDLQANSPLLTPLLINASASGAGGAMQGLGMQGMGMGIGSLGSSV